MKSLKNIRVIEPQKSLDDEKIKHELLSNEELID
jgi:hypothetical protein